MIFKASISVSDFPEKLASEKGRRRAATFLGFKTACVSASLDCASESKSGCYGLNCTKRYV